jgi:hypothetical protein
MSTVPAEGLSVRDSTATRSSSTSRLPTGVPSSDQGPAPSIQRPHRRLGAHLRRPHQPPMAGLRRVDHRRSPASLRPRLLPVPRQRTGRRRNQQRLRPGHLLALDYLRAGGETTQLNLGTGRGHTVLEVVGAVERALGQAATSMWGPRRAGDPPALVASPDRARQVLGWHPAQSSLDQIVESVVAYSS